MIVVRAPSETPNINPADDYNIAYYATGGMTGYNIDYLTGFAYEATSGQFKILGGELIVDGVQVRISGAGDTINIDSVAQNRYFVIHAEVDLRDSSNPSARLVAEYSTSGYVTPSRGDNLRQNPNGLARVPMYRFAVYNGTITNVVKEIVAIDLGKTQIAEINERLDNLGFKEGSVTGLSGAVLKKQGTWAVLELPAITKDNLGEYTMSFTAKEDTNAIGLSVFTSDLPPYGVQTVVFGSVQVTVSSNKVSITYTGTSINTLNIGIQPIWFEIVNW